MGWIFAAVFVWVSVCNAGTVLRWFVRKKSGSMVPLVGGLVGMGAFLLLPYPALNHI